MLQVSTLPDDGDRALRIAMLAPPWLPVPPPGYGGIESVVDSRAPARARPGACNWCWTASIPTRWEALSRRPTMWLGRSS